MAAPPGLGGGATAVVVRARVTPVSTMLVAARRAGFVARLHAGIAGWGHDRGLVCDAKIRC